MVWRGIVFCVVVASVAGILLAFPFDHAPPMNDPAPKAERAVDASSREARNMPDVRDHFAFAATSEPGEDPLTARWNQMAPAERIDILSTQFRDAMDDVAREVDVQRNLETAEGALTVLRSELYAMSHGRERHRAMEEELDRFVRRHAGHRAPEREEHGTR